jgi:hypothetical protein
MSDRAAPGPGRDRAASAGREAAGGGRPQGRAAFIARRAVEQIAALVRRRPERVISIEPADGGWRVGVEVVEVARIPDSADILAVYEVRLDADGDLISYQRTRRYARGDLQRKHRS